MFPFDTHRKPLPEGADPDNLPRSNAYVGEEGNVRLSPDGEDLEVNMCPNTGLVWVQNGDQPTLLVWG